jgi:hypothetical protein
LIETKTEGLDNTGEIRGVRVRVVLALDEPDLIVTIHDRRK